MSDSKRNKSDLKSKDTKRPIVIAKRNKPKEKNETNAKESSVDEQYFPKILSRGKGSTNCINEGVNEVNVLKQPIPFTFDIYQLNGDIEKYLLKSNTDFLVIGICGEQGVGKSTILNLLESNLKSDDFNNIFKVKKGLFPIKQANSTCGALPCTESIQFFINKDRVMYLDCPPVCANQFRKDSTYSELDDVLLLTILSKVCHLLIIVQNDFLNLSMIRLLQFAELAKSNQDDIENEHDFYPELLFIKNRANISDFYSNEQKSGEQFLRQIFKDSQFKINYNQFENSKKIKHSEQEKVINYFVIPDFKDEKIVSHHPTMESIITKLRQKILRTSRNRTHHGGSEMTEMAWFYISSTIETYEKNFFLNCYEEIHKYGSYSTIDQ